MDINNKKDKIIKTLRFVEEKAIFKPSNLRFKSYSKFNRQKIGTPETGQWGKGRVVLKDIKTLFWQREFNRWEIFWVQWRQDKFYSRGRKGGRKTGGRLDSVKNDKVQCNANFKTVDSKDYDVSEKTLHYSQIKDLIETPQLKNTEAKEKLKESGFRNFKVWQTKNRLIRNYWKQNSDYKKRTLPQQFSPALKKHLNTTVNYAQAANDYTQELQFSHPSFTNILSKSSLIWCFGMRRDIKKM